VQLEPIDLPLDSLENRAGYKILVTPQPKIFHQKMANKLPKYDQITLISPRYEGFDQRVTYLLDEEISIPDYLLTGGQLPAIIIADSICRLVPPVIKKE
ncbi:tRNA (guanosine(37)-N1)-methyltransferase TrmD, partial [Mycoplasmopsis synoviae]